MSLGLGISVVYDRYDLAFALAAAEIGVGVGVLLTTRLRLTRALWALSVLGSMFVTLNFHGLARFLGLVATVFGAAGLVWEAHRSNEKTTGR